MTSPAETAAVFVRLDQSAPGPGQIALVSGGDVPLFRLDLPKGLRGQAREQVARRQLSDRFGLTPEQVQMRPFAPGGLGEGWNRVLVAPPSLLADWRGLECRAVLPDYLSLPCAEGVWTVAPQGEMMLARLGPDDGFSATLALTLPMLERALTEQGRPGALYLPEPIPALEDWANSQSIPVAHNESELTAQALPMPQILAHDELSSDLRQDPMAARTRLTANVLPWRWPLLAGALAAALFAASQIVAIQRLGAETDSIAAQTHALVQQHFVPSGPVLDVRVQVARALSQLRAATSGQSKQVDPVQMGWQVAEVVASLSAVPDSLIWRDGDGIQLVLRLPDFAATDRLTAAFSTAGLKAELVESRASTDAQGVRAEFRIQPGGSQ